MSPEDVERLAELEEMIELGDELDEDEQDELKELRHERRGENSKGKLIQQFQKAKRVWRFPDDDETADGYVYTLSFEDMRATVTGGADVDQLSPEHRAALQGSIGMIEEVDRPERAEKLVVDTGRKLFWFQPAVTP